jgi:hypothetical protein
MTMRFGLFLGASAILLSAAAFPGQANADDDDKAPITVNVSGSTVSATTGGMWHMNPEYPWKLKGGDGSKLTGFAFNGQSASIANVPKGSYTLAGGVCADGKDKDGKPVQKCQSFSRPVSVK